MIFFFFFYRGRSGVVMYSDFDRKRGPYFVFGFAVKIRNSQPLDILFFIFGGTVGRGSTRRKLEALRVYK